MVCMRMWLCIYMFMCLCVYVFMCLYVYMFMFICVYVWNSSRMNGSSRAVAGRGGGAASYRYIYILAKRRKDMHQKA